MNYIMFHPIFGNSRPRSLVTPRGLISQGVRIPPASYLLLTVGLLQDTALW